MPTGLTCGVSNSSASLQCIGGAPQWEGGYVAVYVLIAVLFLGCVAVSVVLIRKSAPNHCFDLTYHDRCEGPLVHPYFTVGWRGFWFIFFFVVELIQITDPLYGVAVLQAYTVWNFILQTITLGIGFQLALHFAFGHRAYYCGSEKYQRGCERIHMLLLEITFPLCILVCIVVWGLLVPLGCPLLTFTSFIQHLTNVVVFAVDFIVSGYPVDLRHFAIVVFVVAVYASFVQVFYIMNGSTNCVYPFMMPNCPLSVVWYMGMLLIHFLVYLLAWGLWNMKFCCRRMHAAQGKKCCTPHGTRGDHQSFISTRRSFSKSSASQALVKPRTIAIAHAMGDDAGAEGSGEVREFAGLGYGTAAE